MPAATFNDLFPLPLRSSQLICSSNIEDEIEERTGTTADKKLSERTESQTGSTLAIISFSSSANSFFPSLALVSQERQTD